VLRFVCAHGRDSESKGDRRALCACRTGFAERLLSRLRQSNEAFPVRLTMMDVISRLVGAHQLLLLDFYPFLQRYIQPQQADVRVC
jgi:hypothetical protein